MDPQVFSMDYGQSGATLAAFLRRQFPGKSWSQVRRLIETGRVQIGGELCRDPARRLTEADRIEVTQRPLPGPRRHNDVVLRYLDEHVVVVEKPAGIATVRHPLERHWPRRRKALNLTLEDLATGLISRREGGKRRGPLARLRIVHRLDKETSGLVVFARTPPAERELGRQFRAHSVTRRYLAVVPGLLTSQTMATRLVRDRGDGRRGSTTLPGVGKEAVTHVELIKRLPGYSLLSCRLKTGRTHQIRIHLAELGHPICGERVYNRGRDGVVRKDNSNAPRLALHAAELGFLHPISRRPLHWTMGLPTELQELLIRLASGK
jgi:23S rRNA pseudouridine1911/1915/1917 synthase